MKNPKISIVIPVYKPEEETFHRLKEMLKRQTIKAEVIENWNMPEAKSMNEGIKKAKGEIVVTLSMDCVPEDEFWLERLIKPLEDKNIVVSVSDLYLPEDYWKRYSFLIRLFTIRDKGLRRPRMDARGCAYRKKDLIDMGLFNEDPKVIGIDTDIGSKLEKNGKFAHPNIRVLHLHRYNNLKKMVTNIYNYSKANGMVARKYGTKETEFWIRCARATPIIGLIMIFYRFPFKKNFNLFPAFFIVALTTHLINIYGFWRGFLFKQKESSRNLQVLSETPRTIRWNIKGGN